MNTIEKIREEIERRKGELKRYDNDDLIKYRAYDEMISIISSVEDVDETLKINEKMKQHEQSFTSKSAMSQEAVRNFRFISTIKSEKPINQDKLEDENERYLPKIRTEIERLKSIEYPCDNSQQATGFFNALDRMTDFLDILESEKPINQDVELNDEKWTSSKVAKPEKTGLYLITDGNHWRVLLVNNGEVMIYEDWDDGYTTDKNYLNREWWWRPLPNLPSGKTPYYYE